MTSSAHHSTPASRRNEWLGLAAWLGASFATGAIGGFASANAAGFYAQLDTPSWAPPSRLFGPVWTVLYLMMGIAAWLVWREAGWREGRVALSLFVAQLVLNALWTWLFFAWRLGGVALIEIIVLSVLIIAVIIAFARIQRTAAMLLVPYLAWVLFATALTAALWTRNPALL